MFVGVMDTVAVEDSLYQSVVYARDVDSALFGDLVRYRLVNPPSWLTIDSVSGSISGMPSGLNVRDTVVTVEAYDRKIIPGYPPLKSSLTYPLFVRAVNLPPRFVSVPDALIQEDSLYVYRVVVEDRDVTFGRDSLRIAVLRAPSWLAFDTTQWILTGTPRWQAVGRDTISVAVWDKDSLAAIQTWAVEVLPTFHPPVAARVASPRDSVVITLHTHPRPVPFAWNRGWDQDEEDTLRYSIRVSGPGLDTTTVPSADSSIALDIMPSLEPGGAYVWTVTTTDGRFSSMSDTALFRTSATVVTVEHLADLIPADFGVDAPYPNPFNPSTTIRVGLPVTSDLKVEVFDLLGRKVDGMDMPSLRAGFHSWTWRADRHSSGVYMVLVTAMPVDPTFPLGRSVKRVALVK